MREMSKCLIITLHMELQGTSILHFQAYPEPSQCSQFYGKLDPGGRPLLHPESAPSEWPTVADKVLRQGAWKVSAGDAARVQVRTVCVVNLQ